MAKFRPERFVEGALAAYAGLAQGRLAGQAQAEAANQQALQNAALLRQGEMDALEARQRALAQRRASLGYYDQNSPAFAGMLEGLEREEQAIAGQVPQINPQFPYPNAPNARAFMKQYRPPVPVPPAGATPPQAASMAPAAAPAGAPTPGPQPVRALIRDPAADMAVQSASRTLDDAIKAAQDDGDRVGFSALAALRDKVIRRRIAPEEAQVQAAAFIESGAARRQFIKQFSDRSAELRADLPRFQDKAQAKEAQSLYARMQQNIPTDPGKRAAAEKLLEELQQLRQKAQLGPELDELRYQAARDAAAAAAADRDATREASERGRKLAAASTQATSLRSAIAAARTPAAKLNAIKAYNDFVGDKSELGLEPYGAYDFTQREIPGTPFGSGVLETPGRTETPEEVRVRNLALAAKELPEGADEKERKALARDSIRELLRLISSGKIANVSGALDSAAEISERAGLPMDWLDKISVRNLTPPQQEQMRQFNARMAEQKAQFKRTAEQRDRNLNLRKRALDEQKGRDTAKREAKPPQLSSLRLQQLRVLNGDIASMRRQIEELTEKGGKRGLAQAAQLGARLQAAQKQAERLATPGYVAPGEPGYEEKRGVLVDGTYVFLTRKQFDSFAAAVKAKGKPVNAQALWSAGKREQ